MSRHWLWWRVIQIIIDFFGVWGMAILAYFARVGWILSTDFPFGLYVVMSGIAALVWISVLLFNQFYRVVPVSGKTEFILQNAKILLGGSIAVGVMIVSYFFPKETLFSRWIGVYILIFGSLWLFVSNEIYREFIAWQKKHDKKSVYRTLIVGANRVSEKIIDRLTKDRFAPYKIVGVIDPYGLAAKNFKGKILGKLNKLEDVCDRERVTAMIQCDGFEHTLSLISFCDQRSIKFQFDPALRGVFEGNLRLRKSADIPFISFVQRDYQGTKKLKFKAIDWALRNVFDID